MADDRKSKSKRLNDLRAQLDELGYGSGAGKGRAVFVADDLRRTLGRKKRSDKVERGTTVASPSALDLPGQRSPEPLQAIHYRRDLPRRNTSAAKARGAGMHVSLEDAVNGTELACEKYGNLFLVRHRVCSLKSVASLNDTFSDALDDPRSALCVRLADVHDPVDLSPSDVVFMDIETTGLGCSPLFLIGVMAWGKDGFEVRQFLARNYAEEAATIASFTEACADKKLLVTFNGKSFDFPFIRTRAAATRVPFSLDPSHLDLLHLSRRIWKGKFADCKLQTLERHLCGRVRHGDIPGSEIPDAYHAFVRTGNARQIVDILKHNMLDLVTLADIMTRFPLCSSHVS